MNPSTLRSPGDQVPLIPMKYRDDRQYHHGPISSTTRQSEHTSQQEKEPEPGMKDRRRIYLILTIMSVTFLVLNIVQIAFIFKLNNVYWIVLFPALLFLAFIIFLAFESYRLRKGLKASWREADWQISISRLGIVATVFLCILACEFGYLNAEAVKVAHEKVWKMSLSAYETLPAPAIALVRNSTFPNQLVLVPPSEKYPYPSFSDYSTNRTKFKNPRTIPAGAEFGSLEPDVIDYMTYASDGVLTEKADLDAFYWYYYNSTYQEAIIEMAIFDPKFLSLGLFETAYKCGIIHTDIFPARGRTYVAIEPISINDAVKSIQYSPECDLQEFRNYLTYRTKVIPYAGQFGPSACTYTTSLSQVSGVEPCNGDVDVKFQTMLVTNQWSQYSKSLIDMLSDEGGIIGGIMFVTWFMDILSR